MTQSYQIMKSSNLIRELAVLEGETLRATRLELEASQQRCQLLEDQ